MILLLIIIKKNTKLLSMNLNFSQRIGLINQSIKKFRLKILIIIN